MPTFNPPRRWGMLTPPPAAVAALPSARATSFRNVGWLAGGPDESAVPSVTGPGWIYNATPAVTPQVPGPLRPYKVAPRDIYHYSDPPEVLGVALWRRQAVASLAPTQYGSDSFALGHYSPFRTGIPIRSTSPFVESSGFQPISRGGHVLVSLTEVQQEGGPAATARRFANTRFGLWFKAWVIGGANVRPFGSVQTPSPQFRGVLPSYGYTTIPQIIGQ
jgi:hypothetical protein